jgi:diguanylate cyclase (GGDEF)-like protein
MMLSTPFTVKSALAKWTLVFCAILFIGSAVLSLILNEAVILLAGLAFLVFSVYILLGNQSALPHHSHAAPSEPSESESPEPDAVPSGASRAQTHVSYSDPVNNDDQENTIEMLDDTQASIFFNQTSDGIIHIIHQTFQAHSAFFYLYDATDGEWVLQSFRSMSAHFSTASRHPMADSPAMSLFRTASESLQSISLSALAAEQTCVFYYTRPVNIQSLVLLPLVRRGVLLGILGIDHTQGNYYSASQVELLGQFARLMLQTIQNIDGVYVKNKLRKMFQDVREYNEYVKSGNSEEQIFKIFKNALSNNIPFDKLFLWLRTGVENEVLLADTAGDSEFPKGMKRSLEGRIESYVMQKQKRIYIPDFSLNTEPSEEFAEDQIYENHLQTVLAVPLSDQGHCFGALILEADENDAFDAYEVQFAETLCHTAGLALARAHLDKHLSAEIAFDPLTGLDNYHVFLNKLNTEILRAKRFETNFTLLVFHIDYVKTIYESFGVVSGDFVLEKIAEILKHSIRQIDVAARLSHDRFGLLLVENKREEAVECAERLLKNIESSIVDFEGESVPLTATIGISVFGRDGENAAALIEAAEKAAAAAKKSKQKRIAFFS